MNCFKCKKEIILNHIKKIGFREICPDCSSDLHVCLNCQYYMPGKPNDCNVPNTEFVSKKYERNFCEDFKPSDRKIKEQSSKKDIAKKLFKDEDDDDSAQSFNDLFKD